MFLRRANRSWNISLSSLSNHLNGKTRSRKMKPRGGFIKEKKIYNDQMDLKSVKMLIVYKPITIKDEGCKVDINKEPTNLKWNTQQ